MKIINAAGTQLPALVIGMAKQQAASVARAISLRPFKKTIAYTADATQDLYIIIIQLFQNPALNRAIIVNGNEFRITNVVNEVLGDGSMYPTVTWKGGIPPFTIKLIYSSVDGNTQIYDVSNMCVNVNSNLTDGTGDIVTSDMAREYIVTKIDDADGWWADDLETEDLGFDETINTQKRQNAIGLQIEDSTTIKGYSNGVLTDLPAPRILFVPFSPNPLYETDGITPTGLFAKYPERRFGPPTWCIPLIHWDQPATITYGEALKVGVQLDAVVHIPGTTTTLPGGLHYWLDVDYTIPAENIVPDANSGLPLYATFQATDTLHYHQAVAEQGIVVNKADQQIYITRDTVTNWGRVGDIGNVKAETRSTYLGVLTATGLSVSINSSNTSVAIFTGDINSSAGATWTFVGAGKVYAYLDQSGDHNHNPAPRLTTATHNVNFAMNAPGGVSFDINDGPITYGEALDVLCWAPIAGNSAYQTSGEPAGWIVHPTPGTYLETNTNGTPREHSITAQFYPLDTDRYPSPMDYEQWLTVNKNIPVPIWSTANSYVYGMKWQDIMNALFYNSHHIEVFGWAVEGVSLYEVSGHSNSVWNGVVENATLMPDVDSGFFVSCQFTPTGVEAHNYEIPEPTNPSDHGFSITQKALTVTANTAYMTYNGSVWNGGNGVTYNGFVPGQDQNVLSGGLTFSGAAQGAINAGSYVNGIVPGGLTSDNYAITFVPGSLVIYKATPDITFSSPEFIIEGQTLSAYKATSSISGITFTYHSGSPSGPIIDMDAAQSFNTGLAIYVVTNETPNYATAWTWDGVVVKGVPIITWPDPAAITYGTALSGTQLNATADVSGTFTYSPPAGTVPNADSGLVLNVTFTPSDSTHYTAATDWAGIVVNKANQYITGYLGDSTLYTGQSTGISITAYGSSGNPVTYSSSNPSIASVSGTTVTATGVGVCYIIASQAGNSNYNAGSFFMQVDVHAAVSTWVLSYNDCADQGIYSDENPSTWANGGTGHSTMPANFLYNNLDGTWEANNSGNGVIHAVKGTYPNREWWTLVWDDDRQDIASPGSGCTDNDSKWHVAWLDWIFGYGGGYGTCDGAAEHHTFNDLVVNHGFNYSGNLSFYPSILRLEYCNATNREAKYKVVRKYNETLT
jgi:hypothetical protein